MNKPIRLIKIRLIMKEIAISTNNKAVNWGLLYKTLLRKTKFKKLFLF